MGGTSDDGLRHRHPDAIKSSFVGVSTPGVGDRVRRGDVFLNISLMRIRTGRCPLSAQSCGKLMQKNHRLTDN